jgi:DNA-binding XRE family transcriptional regulator
LGLTQDEVAARLGANTWTYLLWEKDEHIPAIRFYPAIFDFLGYDPFPAPKTLGERILSRRRAWGLSQKKAAQQIGVDLATYLLLETGKFAGMRYERGIADFLSGNQFCTEISRRPQLIQR